MVKVAKVTVIYEPSKDAYIISEHMGQTVNTKIMFRREMREFINDLNLPENVIKHIQEHIQEISIDQLANIEA